MSLDVNFKDDILNTAVNQKRKYHMIHNDDGTVSFEDSTVYSQVGSVFGAKEVNEERLAINKIRSDMVVSLEEVDLVTEPGFFVDAMAVRELNGKMQNMQIIKKEYEVTLKNNSYLGVAMGTMDIQKSEIDTFGTIVSISGVAVDNCPLTVSYWLSPDGTLKIQYCTPKSDRGTIYITFMKL